jgi:hypothetical protein
LLKTLIDGKTWLISQPDHAAVSGYLIAHWGNQEFAKPGYYAETPRPEELRAETIFGIAEHDNGWWEWEADPRIDPRDGLPLHLTDVPQQEGFENWRRGVPRFQERHPYAALLISLHAYWIYAPRVEDDPGPVFRHPLFGDAALRHKYDGEELLEARRFLAEQKQAQAEILAGLHTDAAWASAARPAGLNPHVRLLQLADALSLALCFGGGQSLSLLEIPRRNWNDRVTLELSPQPENRIVCRPYPFDVNPLPVTLRARILGADERPGGDFQAWWQGIPRQQICFAYCSG